MPNKKFSVFLTGLSGAGKIRVNQSGCLDRCEEGPVCVVYPEGTWYTYVDEMDVDEIIGAGGVDNPGDSLQYGFAGRVSVREKSDVTGVNRIAGRKNLGYFSDYQINPSPPDYTE